MIGFFSCSDDDGILTEGEKNAQKLNELIDGRELDNIWVSWTFGEIRYNESYQDPDYEIEGSFFRIGRDYFNLAKLKKITDWGSSRIDLDFE